MRKILLIFGLAVSFLACQDEERQEVLNATNEKETEQDSIQVLTGDFIYVSDEAVFRGENFVYGVTIDSLAEVLAKQTAAYKKEDFDVVSVKIKGKIVPNSSRNNWDENIEIQEIIDILEDKKTSENNSEEENEK